MGSNQCSPVVKEERYFAPNEPDAQQEIDEIRFDCARSFKLIDGQWYFVVYEIIEMARYEPVRAMWNVVQRRQVQLTWGRNRVAVHKRQCNREEIRAIHERIAEWKREVRKM